MFNYKNSPLCKSLLLLLKCLIQFSLSFPEKQGQPAKAIKNEKTRKALGKFEGNPTYKSE